MELERLIGYTIFGGIAGVTAAQMIQSYRKIVEEPIYENIMEMHSSRDTSGIANLIIKLNAFLITDQQMQRSNMPLMFLKLIYRLLLQDVNIGWPNFVTVTISDLQNGNYQVKLRLDYDASTKSTLFVVPEATRRPLLDTIYSLRVHGFPIGLIN